MSRPVTIRNYCEGCGQTFRSEEESVVCPSCAKASPSVEEHRLRQDIQRDNTRLMPGTFVKRPHKATPADYQAMAVAQGGKCAICELRPVAKALVIDHNHRTGNVRGLLCSDCNTGIGLLGDNPITLSRAAQYLAANGYYGSHPRMAEEVRARAKHKPIPPGDYGRGLPA